MRRDIPYSERQFQRPLVVLVLAVVIHNTSSFYVISIYFWLRNFALASMAREW